MEDGDVAIVTGGGRGLGAAHAELLGQRGFRVVVNDLGASGIDGRGELRSVAEEVAARIRSGGGQAVSSTSDISNGGGVDAVLELAIEAFGRVDVLVHSAGIARSGGFADLAIDDFRAMFDVNVMGAILLGRRVWPGMLERGYGRIVLTSSSAALGLPFASPYATSKAALIGLCRALAAEAEAMGPDVDLKVNAIAPIADSRMGAAGMRDLLGDLADPACVAPVVAYLASRSCTVNGEVLHTGASHVSRLTTVMTKGWAKGSPDLTPEDVAANLAAVLDLEGATNPSTVLDALEVMVAGALGDEAVEGLRRWMDATLAERARDATAG